MDKNITESYKKLLLCQKYNSLTYALYAHLDSFTISLHNPSGKHLLTVKAVEGNCGVWKTGEIPISHVSPWCLETEAFLNLYLDQPSTNRWFQLTGVPVLQPPDGAVEQSSTHLGGAVI